MSRSLSGKSTSVSSLSREYLQEGQQQGQVGDRGEECNDGALSLLEAARPLECRSQVPLASPVPSPRIRKTLEMDYQNVRQAPQVQLLVRLHVLLALAAVPPVLGIQLLRLQECLQTGGAAQGACLGSCVGQKATRMGLQKRVGIDVKKCQQSWLTMLLQCPILLPSFHPKQNTQNEISTSRHSASVTLLPPSRCFSASARADASFSASSKGCGSYSCPAASCHSAGRGRQAE